MTIWLCFEKYIHLVTSQITKTTQVEKWDETLPKFMTTIEFVSIL